jgi:long-chain acyl-CoA synthetase
MSRVHTNKPGFYGKGSVEISKPVQGEGTIRRCAISADALVTQPGEGIDTVFDIVSYAAMRHGTRKALGWRDVLEVVEEEKEVKKVIEGKEVTDKKIWKYFKLSDYKFLNFVEIKEIVSEIARAMLELGFTVDDVFNVYAQTRCVPFPIVLLYIYAVQCQSKLATNSSRLCINLNTYCNCLRHSR